MRQRPDIGHLGLVAPILLQLAVGCSPSNTLPPQEPTVVTLPLVALDEPGADQRIQVGRALLKSSRFGDAEIVFAALVRDFPHDARVRFLLALSIHKQQRYAKAMDLYREVIAMPGDFPERKHMDHYIGWAQFHQGEMGPAIEAFAEHVRRVPDADDSWFGMGSAYLDLDNAAEAQRCLKMALDCIDARQPADQRARAKLLSALGDVASRTDRQADAAQLYEQAVSLWPDHYEVWERLARVRDMTGDSAGAAAARSEAEAARVRVGRIGPARAPAAAEAPVEPRAILP